MRVRPVISGCWEPSLMAGRERFFYGPYLRSCGRFISFSFSRAFSFQVFFFVRVLVDHFYRVLPSFTEFFFGGNQLRSVGLPSTHWSTPIGVKKENKTRKPLESQAKKKIGKPIKNKRRTTKKTKERERAIMTLLHYVFMNTTSPYWTQHTQTREKKNGKE